MAEPSTAPSENMIEAVYIGSSEETFFKSPMVPESYLLPYNPDDLYQKHADYSVYEDMLNDDQISVCLQLKKDLVLGSGFDFISEEEDQEEITEFLCDALDDSCLMEACEEILSAYEMGFSLTEKIFETNNDGMVVLKSLKTRHPNSWMIYQDDAGNVTKYEQNTVSGLKDIDPKSLIHYINQGKYQNPYGKSDLRACYAAWFAKRQVVRYYGIYLEKAASPTPVAKYDKNAPDSAVTKIFNTIKKLQASTAMAIPKEIEVDYLESRTNGEAYSKAINIFNMFIGRSLFIPDLLGLTGSETGGGSYSLGKEQINIFFMHIARRRAQLEKLLNQHIIWPMIVTNFGFVENYPKLRFKPIDDMKAVELAKIWLEAVRSKTFKPNEEEINYFRSLVKFPEGEVEFNQPLPIPGMQPNQSAMLKDKENEQEDEAKGKKQPKEEEQRVCPVGTRMNPNTGECIPISKYNELFGDKKEYGKAYNLPPGDYHKKVDFKKIDTKLKDYTNSVLIDAKPVMRKQLIDLFDQIEKKKILKNQDVAKIDTLKLKYLKELKQILKSSFTQLYKDSKSMAASELLKSSYRTPVATEAFLEMLEDETYQYIGDYSYSMLKRVRTQLIAAIKDGKPLSTVLDELEPELLKFGEVGIERYSRTKHTEVMNKGRHEFFEESGFVSGYQYSAILDEATSKICSGLDGKYFEAGTEPIPPMHFNCRSVLIPITKYEEFKPSEKAGGMPIDEFIEENKGDGFAKYSKEVNLTDPSVEFVTERINDVLDETTYSKDGIKFLMSVVEYKDKERQEIKSVRKIRLDDGANI